MFFDQLFERLPFLNNNKTNKIQKRCDPLLARRSKKEKEKIAIEAANNFIAEKEYKKALRVINETLETGNTTNKLLFKKAFLLSQNEQHDKAERIWSKLANLKSKPKLAATAKKCLEASKQSQEKALINDKLLLNKLHSKANQYQWKLKDLPKSDYFHPETNFTQLICQEAERARTAELPKLAFDLIEIAINAGHKSPLTIHHKAICLNMMGQSKEALKLLRELSSKIKNPEFKAKITKSISEFKNPSKQEKARLKIYMLKQANRFAKASNLKIQFLPKTKEYDSKIDVKHLIIKESRNALKINPLASLDLTNSILDYFPDNSLALQAKAEALASLKQDEQALKVWLILIQSQNRKAAQEASRSISQLFGQEAESICAKNTPEEAVRFFISRHLKHKITPAVNPNIKSILMQLEPAIDKITDPKLRHHKLRLAFNTHIVDFLENRPKEQGHLNDTARPQKLGVISETAPKAG